MPAEKLAYALARYSRSADSIRESIEWVRSHDSRKFLESFYFQYGHASIADLGHLAICFEGVSELAATEIEDEPLWDGQAKSTRYQDFSKLGVVTPPELAGDLAAVYQEEAAALIGAYTQIQAAMAEHLAERLPMPEGMKPDAYRRNLAARAFDVARYLLPFGIPTNAGQVTSIRTLERQIRRLKASEYAELRQLGDQTAKACEADDAAPTLAKYVGVDEYLRQSREDVTAWVRQNLPDPPAIDVPAVDLSRPADTVSDIVATILYPHCRVPYRALYELAREWPAARRAEVLDVALRSRSRHDEILREFRGAVYVYDIVMDLGAYRDLHRHRRCHQFRQAYSTALGCDVPEALEGAGLTATYRAAADRALAAADRLPVPGSHYLLPLATRGRFLFKMDFAEAEYIAKLRTGVKGHFSYRRVAWEMRERMLALEPELGRLVEATPPWEEDPLTR
jgi:thymidylate synthase ThyX